MNRRDARVVRIVRTTSRPTNRITVALRTSESAMRR
jgi:hypothetical protein